MRIALLVSEFNGEVTSRMLDVALERAAALGLDISRTCRVPGTYDMPVVADALLARDDVDGVVALGAVVRGGTKHDEVIAHAAASALAGVAVRRGKPVSFGVSGPGTMRQAHARIRPVAERAVEAVRAVSAQLGEMG
ncbi:MAG: 6,7-dimethyl-8-ribityllumazine synthase [Nitrosopumilus sp.]|nr:6,7-dimethyl-8-ribityllumazine synthase [Nitrosopumilus sp.]MDA7960405.1 6,7-dimethyl-8-ribityllumazine synthase [Nitrosopumilus sp.]